MKEIPFDLEKAKAGDPILVSGRPACYVAHVPEARDDERIVVVCDGRIYVFTESGVSGAGCAYKLTMAPKKHVRWVNLYPNKKSLCDHASRELADECACSDRIACLRIEFTEGEGLEEVKP